MKNSALRNVGRSVLANRGFDVLVNPGQGYLPGARLIAKKAGKTFSVVVKASQQRTVSFTKQSKTRWRSLHAADLVVAVVPAKHHPDEADVFGFERKPLERIFNRAWKELENAKRPLGFNIPVFVPIDEVSRKNVGHNLNNLRKRADWSVHVGADELARSSVDEENYVEHFRRRFAAENGVDVSQVAISIVGKPGRPNRSFPA